MKKKLFNNSQLFYMIVVCVLAILFAVGIRLFTNQNGLINHGLYAEAITLDDVPETIRSEMNANMDNAGAYFYKETDESKDVYALLTAGHVVGVDLNVEPVVEDGGMFFSVDFSENGEVEEKLVYAVYKTNASAVAGGDLRLKNPYLKIGATGMNVGILKKMDSGIGYYITPIMDTEEINRIYTPADDSLANLKNGLYLYTYQLTTDGTLLTSAEKQDGYEVLGVMTEFHDDPVASVTLMLGDQIKIQAIVKDESILTALRERDFDQYSVNCWATISANDEVTITSLHMGGSNLLAKEMPVEESGDSEN